MEDRALEEMLREQGQAHLLPPHGATARSDDDRTSATADAPNHFFETLRKLHANYPGGLPAYLETARRLLSAASRGDNPLAGWTPQLPTDGIALEPTSPEHASYEREGLAHARQLAFVVPAGGLGERLGYSGVKFALPAETATEATVLETYAAYILATQRAAEREARSSERVRLPLAIMVSDDTESAIVELLERTGCYGLERDQITLLKQEKVAALADAEARIASASGSTPYTLLTKPHGHGDVHFLLHASGTARAWEKRGVRWLYFFQDTSTLYFASHLATLGVSVRHNFALNLVAVPRKAKEAIGAIARLTHVDGRSIVANVEYNQLEPLLRATGSADGDCNDPATGYSPYPGSINGLVFHLPSYLETLARTAGKVDEFVNPKWLDPEARTVFKSPTRLECMMQDYAKTVLPTHRVGWTRYPVAFGYFPCKNDIRTAARLSAAGVPPHSASTSEAAVYEMHATTLRRLGCRVAAPPTRSFRGVEVALGAAVVLHPSFAPCATLLRAKFPRPDAVTISARSALIVHGEHVEIHELELDGALVIHVEEGASLTIHKLVEHNMGWTFCELSDEEQEVADETAAIRGYRLERHASREIRVPEGEHRCIGAEADAVPKASSLKRGRAT